MNKKDVIDLVKRCIQEVQAMSGEADFAIEDDTIPIFKLPGFDSPRGLEVTHLLVAKLGIVVNSYPNLCVSEDGTKRLNVSQIADRVLKLLSKTRRKG